MKFVLRDKVSLGFNPRLSGNGGWYALSALSYPVAIAVILGLGLLLGFSTINNFTIPAFATG